MHWRLFLPLLAAAALIAGCPSDDDTTLVLRCLSNQPEAGTSCPRDQLICEYGDDPRPSCRTRAVCDAGNWRIDESQCTPLTEAGCPTTLSDQGSACSGEGDVCDVEGFACTCTNCDDTGPVSVCEGDPIWRCSGGSSDMSCPSPIARLGSSCPSEGQVCTYGCGFGNARRCESGLWFSDDGGPCPMSSARYKRDIAHLSAAQREALRQETLAIPLATYRYRDPVLGQGHKLGFIIEELPASSPAVRPGQKRVDLYGYTSMLLATIQAQQAQIERLERRIERLEQSQH